MSASSVSHFSGNYTTKATLGSAIDFVSRTMRDEFHRIVASEMQKNFKRLSESENRDEFKRIAASEMQRHFKRLSESENLAEFKRVAASEMQHNFKRLSKSEKLVSNEFLSGRLAVVQSRFVSNDKHAKHVRQHTRHLQQVES
eukprot:138931_1